MPPPPRSCRDRPRARPAARRPRRARDRRREGGRRGAPERHARRRRGQVDEQVAPRARDRRHGHAPDRVGQRQAGHGAGVLRGRGHERRLHFGSLRPGPGEDTLEVVAAGHDVAAAAPGRPDPAREVRFWTSSRARSTPARATRAPPSCSSSTSTPSSLHAPRFEASPGPTRC